MANAGDTSYEREFAGNGDVVAAKSAVHPLVITHPDSGRKALFVNRGYTAQIVGMSRAGERRAAGLPVPAFDRARAGLSPQLARRTTW